MTKEELESAFLNYADGSRPPVFASPTDPVAILFGSDQFRINWDNRTITLPLIGEHPLDDADEPYEPEWVALIPDNACPWVTLMLGIGNPYRADADNHLPRKRGQILAVPYGLTPSTLSYPETRQQRRARERAARKQGDN